MVRPLPTLSRPALVSRGRLGQSDESAVPALPPDRAGDARDVPDGGPFAARLGTEETALQVDLSCGRHPTTPLGWAPGDSRAIARIARLTEWEDKDVVLLFARDRLPSHPSDDLALSLRQPRQNHKSPTGAGECHGQEAFRRKPILRHHERGTPDAVLGSGNVRIRKRRHRPGHWPVTRD